jgi:hypothetical protein
VDVSQWNESDVREEVITPLLHRIGYRSGTPNDIRRELSLRYPYDFLGRKKPGDPPLRGRFDYICEIDQRIRWVIEAKPPVPSLTADDAEQAFTYARHPEIAATHFCLCNGMEFLVFLTDSGPALPIATFLCADFEGTAGKLLGLLGPDVLRKQFADRLGGLRQSIGAGLGSFAQIVGGHVVFERNSMNLPHMHGLVVTILGGALQRHSNDSLLAYFKTLISFAEMQNLNERLGLDRFEAVVSGNSLSTDDKNPNVFDAHFQVRIPRGETMMTFQPPGQIQLAVDVDCRVAVSGTMTLSGHQVHGRFDATYEIFVPSRPTAEMIFNGRFVVEVR